MEELGGDVADASTADLDTGHQVVTHLLPLVVTAAATRQVLTSYVTMTAPKTCKERWR